MGGIGSGLEQLAQQKRGELLEKRGLQQAREGDLKALQRIGFSPEEAEILRSVKEIDPHKFSDYFGRALENIATKSPSQQQIQGETISQQAESKPLFGQSEAQKQKKEAHEQKLIKAAEPTRDYLENLSGILENLLDLAENGDVNFGSFSSAAASLPFGIGSSVGAVNTDTGLYNTYANEFLVDSAKTTGVDTNAKLKAREASKMGLNKSKEQNIKEIKHYLDKVNKHKNVFYKQHPYVLPYGKSEESAVKGSQSASSVSKEGPLGAQAKNKKSGKVFQWNPQTKKYDIPA